MLSPNEIALFAERCISISNEADDGTGFVPIRNLIRRFNAEIVFRPLLVEAMLAKKPSGGPSDADGWAVLLDSERYGSPIEKMDAETSSAPLESRLRNTIAHELVHSLAFRHTEFGIQLGRKAGNGESLSALVNDIESETERLSPLLVASDKAIEKLLTANTEPSIDQFAAARIAIGVSRYVLVSRLNLLRVIDKRELLGMLQLQDIALGIGEWSNKDHAMILGRPIFTNFEKNAAPDFLLKAFKDGNAPANTLFADKNFVLCGGSSQTTTMKATAGRQEITLECSIEKTERRTRGETFLVLFRRTDNPMRHARIAAAEAALEKKAQK